MINRVIFQVSASCLQGKFRLARRKTTPSSCRSQPPCTAARESNVDTFSVEIAEADKMDQAQKTSPGSCVSA